MMMNSEARRCGLVVLSAESAERSTPYLCRIFDATWPPCYPDLPGLRIYDPVPGLPTGPGVNFSRRSKVCRLRLGRLVALGRIDCSRQSAVLTPTSAQLRGNRPASELARNRHGAVGGGPSRSAVGEGAQLALRRIGDFGIPGGISSDRYALSS